MEMQKYLLQRKSYSVEFETETSMSQFTQFNLFLNDIIVSGSRSPQIGPNYGGHA